MEIKFKSILYTKYDLAGTQALQSLKSDHIVAIHLTTVLLFQESLRDTRQVRRLSPSPSLCRMTNALRVA